MKQVVCVSIAMIALALTACATATPTPVPPAATLVPPTATRVPPTPTVTPLPPTATPVPPTLKEMADQVADKLGKVMKIVEGDPKRVVFLFEERHDSGLGQIEIAAMLNRLYDKFQLKHIGLEGHPAEKGPLNLSWAHSKPYFQRGQNITAREDVIAYTLKAGEIGSAEFMGLIYADVVVDGIDDAKLYAVEYPQEGDNALGEYLFQIAYTRMSNANRSAYLALVNQKRERDAFFFAIGADKFTAEADARLHDQVNFISLEEEIELLDKIEAEAQKAGIKPPPTYQANLNLLREYLRTASQRSDALVANLLKVVAASPGAPVAMTIGAAHTPRMVELFAKSGVSLVVIRPRSLAETSTAGLLGAEAYQRKKKGQSVAPAGYLGALLEGRRKPPPVADGEAFKRQLILKENADRLAQHAEWEWRSGKSPAEIKQSLLDMLKGTSWGPYFWRAGIEEIKIDKVEQIRIPGDPGDAPGEYDRVKVDFKVVFADPSSWAGAGIELEGSAWAGKEKPYVPVVDHLLGIADVLRKETAPSSPAPTLMVKPEQISSNGFVSWSTVKTGK